MACVLRFLRGARPLSEAHVIQKALWWRRRAHFLALCSKSGRKAAAPKRSRLDWSEPWLISIWKKLNRRRPFGRARVALNDPINWRRGASASRLILSGAESKRASEWAIQRLPRSIWQRSPLAGDLNGGGRDLGAKVCRGGPAGRRAAANALVPSPHAPAAPPPTPAPPTPRRPPRKSAADAAPWRRRRPLLRLSRRVSRVLVDLRARLFLYASVCVLKLLVRCGRIWLIALFCPDVGGGACYLHRQNSPSFLGNFSIYFGLKLWRWNHLALLTCNSDQVCLNDIWRGT